MVPKTQARSKSNLSLALLLSTGSLLTGCVVHHYTSPAINGIITRQGQPSAGTTVSLTHFESNVQTTRTDAAGRFAFDAQGEWQVFIPVGPQDRLTRWSVIIAQPPGTITGYESGGIGGVFSGYSRHDQITLRCNISANDRNSVNPENTPVCREINP